MESVDYGMDGTPLVHLDRVVSTTHVLRKAGWRVAARPFSIRKRGTPGVEETTARRGGPYARSDGTRYLWSGSEGICVYPSNAARWIDDPAQLPEGDWYAAEPGEEQIAAGD